MLSLARPRLPAACLAIAVVGWTLPATAATPVETHVEPTVRVAIVDALAETGLAQWLADDFREVHPDVRLSVLAASDAELLEMGRASEVDLIVAHHRPSEELFVAEGWGRSRTLLMYGQFMLYGPPGDKLQLQGESDVRVVMRKLVEAGVPVRAAAIDTGAGLKLAELWAMSGGGHGKGDYAAVEGGSQKAVRAAADAHGYTLAEVGVFLPLARGVRERLEPLVRPTPALRDPYSVIAVAAERAPGVREALADRLREYLLSERGQNRIAAFIPHGAPSHLFVPAAGDDWRLVAERRDAEGRVMSLALVVLLAVLLAAAGVAVAIWLRWRDAKRSNRRHRKVEERLSLGFAASGHGLFDWDRRDGQVYLSRRFRRIARMGTRGHWFPEPDELWSRVLHPEDRERVKKSVEAAFATDGDGRLDVLARLDPERGDPQPVAIRGLAHRHRRGGRMRLVGTISLVGAPLESPGEGPEDPADEDRDDARTGADTRPS